jgi:hypothetical protein
MPNEIDSNEIAWDWKGQCDQNFKTGALNRSATHPGWAYYFVQGAGYTAPMPAGALRLDDADISTIASTSCIIAS